MNSRQNSIPMELKKQSVFDNLSQAFLIFLFLSLLPALVMGEVLIGETVTAETIVADPLPGNTQTLTEISTSTTSSSSVNLTKNTYGPVKNNEGLWDIAAQLHLDLHNVKISIPQIAVALYENNPTAFINQNINGLLVGSTLILPDAKQIMKRSKQDAFSLFLQHWDIWKDPNNVEKINSQFIVQNEITSEPVQKILPVKIKEQPELVETTTIDNIVLESTIPENTALESTTLTSSRAQSETSESNISEINTPKWIASIYENIQQNILTTFYWVQFHLQSYLNTDFLNTNFSSNKVFRSAATVTLIGLLFIIFVTWLYKREETDFTEMKMTRCNIEPDNSSSEIFINDETPTIKDDIPNQVNIDKFITQKKKKVKRKNILEAAFENTSFLNNTPSSNTISDSGNTHLNNIIPITDDVAYTTNIETNIEPNFKSNNEYEQFASLNSNDEIKFINEETYHSKINAFFEATDKDKITDSILSHDFDALRHNDKVDVFIDEFENILEKLNSHILFDEQSSNEQENLLQFVSSLHFIKILSEMMQDDYLKQFSTTIIEFLDDILVGKTKMTPDIRNRLSLAVNFYTQYINCLKNNHNEQIQA